MAVVIRLQRTGKRGQPSFRVVAIEKSRGPKGKPIEILGSYNPRADKAAKIAVKAERVEYWLKCGAKPSESLASLIKKPAAASVAAPRPAKKAASASKAKAQAS